MGTEGLDEADPNAMMNGEGDFATNPVAGRCHWWGTRANSAGMFL